MYDPELEAVAQELSAANVDSATGANIIFYAKLMENPAKTREAGTPQYEELDYVKIKYAGTKDYPDRPVKEEDKFKYPIQWARYKNTKDAETRIDGVPVEQWTMIDRAKAAELKAQGFFTVEQISMANDEQCKVMGIKGFELKKEAKTFLETSKGGAVSQKLAEENVKLSAQIEESNKVILEMKARMDALEAKANEIPKPLTKKKKI